jgi:phosphoenolpyruvate-protein kinase (PTS system EI component)
MAAVMGSGQQEVVDGILMGIGRSPGRIAGRARVVSGLVPADLDCLTDEDVLVRLEDIPYRVDWLGLFLVVKGLVAANQCGAGLHHAAQIARECGVVYVELPGELANRIPDGSTIELDGDLGEVRIPHQ